MSDTDLLADTGEASLDPVAPAEPAPAPAEAAPAGEKPAEGVDKGEGAPLSPDASGDLLSDDGDTAEKPSETSYSFEAPEGFEDLDPSVFDALKEVAAELELSQDQFQKLAEFDLRNAQTADKMAVDAYQERVNSWKQEVLSDKDIGGEKFAETKVNAKAALEKFADPSLVKIFGSPSAENPEGLAIGNHPAVMKFLNRIGKALGEPDFHGGEETTSDADTLQRLYPSMFKTG